MCYSTRQTKTGSQLASIFNSTLFLGETDNTKELIYFHAQGFTHPVMWIVPQEDPLFYNIHNKDKEWERRRPVILNDEDVDEWLYDGNTAFDVNSIIADDLWEGELEAYPISRDLNSRTLDSNKEDIIEKVEYGEVTINY